MTRPLFATFPSLGGRLEAVALGDFPTPVERLVPLEALTGATPLYVKRDDLSSPVYGGNKVRTLEVLFGGALALGARRITATGAFGSNHAVATALHAPRAKLEPGAVLFPQPESWAALENLRITLSYARTCSALPHWSVLPFGMWRARRRGDAVMTPGGATPYGALGYVSAALELAEQVAAGQLEPPRVVAVGIGSTCTTAGLLTGFVHAARLGLGFREPPLVLAVRVTPWPVTSRTRILSLAVRASALLAELAARPELRLPSSELARHLRVEGRELGPGYGRASDTGRATLELFRENSLFPLDTTYSSKAAAGFLRAARADPAGPLLWWSTKSTVPLPPVDHEALCAAPAIARRWIERCEGMLAARHELPASYMPLVSLR